MNPADVKEEILQAAQAYLDTGEIPYLPYQGYQEYLESGNRVAFESHYFARRRMLVVLGLAYEMERKAAIKVLLEQVIWKSAMNIHGVCQRICRLSMASFLRKRATQSIFLQLKLGNP